MIFVRILLLLSACSSVSLASLLTEIGHFYTPNAKIDDVNSIAIDPDNRNIYAANTASGTIDIISYDITIEEKEENTKATLQMLRSIDIHLQSSPYFVLDYITSIAYSPKGYIIASLIPLNYAQVTGWLVFIDTDTMYIVHFIELAHCYSPKHVLPTSDGNKLIISCEGLADGDIADPEGSISVIDTTSEDATEWRIYNVDFNDFDCYGEDEHSKKPLPSSIYQPKADSVFSVNAEPEYMTIDDDDHYAYIVLQENNGVAILDIEQLSIVTIFSFGAHDFGYSGLDASDKDNGINIARYDNVYGLRQPDGISYYSSNQGKRYILTANEGNPKYYDTVRVSEVRLDPTAFPDRETLQQDDHLGRLQILNGAKYGENDDGEFEAIYTFGSRDFAVWEVEGSLDDDCPCSYPYGLRLAYSSYDDFEQITAAKLGPSAFNSDLYVPSSDTRSDDKGPEPESIVIGECNNGDVYVFIGLERVGGIMVYDITDIDDGSVTFVEYLNTRDFDIDYDDDTRPPSLAGDVEPETLIFVSDDDDMDGIAYLIVGYKTSASIGVYSFNCGINRNYDKNAKPKPLSAPVAIARSADECLEQSPCLNVDIRPITMTRRLLADDTQYEVCLEFNDKNPFCSKTEDYFSYGVTLDNEENTMDPSEWFSNDAICQIAACGNVVEFAIKDGDGCSDTKELSVDMDGVPGIICKANANDDYCQWSVATPRCDDVMSTTSSTSSTSDNKDYEVENIKEELTEGVNNQYGEDNKENRNTFDTMTNKGGHFYQSTMFFILLSTCILTCVGIIGCVVKHSKESEAEVEGDIEEQAVEFEE